MLPLGRLGILLLLPVMSGAASAQTFLAPGDTGSIEYPIENDTQSPSAIDGAEMEVIFPPHFIVKGTSIRGPDTIPPAAVKSFVVDYEIAADAPEGPFNIVLQPTAQTREVTPPWAALHTSVNSNIADPHFLVGAEKLMFPDFANQNARNPGFGGIHYSETHARCITAGGLLAGVRV